MCGIAGTLAHDSSDPADSHLAGQLGEALAHRGPDDDGLHVDGPVALAHRRLAILDLSAAGRQPMLGEDGRVAAVVNGEIYDHRTLRRELESRGHRFRSHSDSEVLVHLYEDEGERCLERLSGMFAFALWDGHAQKLVLARDRFGKKPLYWRMGPRGLEFASELQAFLSLGRAEEIDLEALDLYLALQYIPSPHTALRGIHKLPAGHVLVARPGRTPEVRAYWRLSFAPGPDAPERDLVREVRARLERAVRRRLEADVPLGAFLSGGIDSSTVVALLARAARGPVHTFSVGFEGDPAPELPYARLVARHLGTRHEEIAVRPDLEGLLPDLARRYGEPFADPSAIPTYYLAEATRRHVTVALSGDGGDEMFAGYTRYQYAAAGALLARLPAPARALASLVGARLPGARLETARRFARLLGSPDVVRYLQLVGFAMADERRALWAPEVGRLLPLDAARARFEAILEASDAGDDLNRLLDLDVQTYLADCILPKVDIASMAHALEVRSPLLDQELAELVAPLPSHLKRGKRLLRRAAADLIPRPILRRRKRGFDPPLARWLRGPLRPMLGDALRGLAGRGLFQPAALHALLADHDRGLDRSNVLYSLLVLELWHRAAQETCARAAALERRTREGGR